MINRCSVVKCKHDYKPQKVIGRCISTATSNDQSNPITIGCNDHVILPPKVFEHSKSQNAYNTNQYKNNLHTLLARVKTLYCDLLNVRSYEVLGSVQPPATTSLSASRARNPDHDDSIHRESNKSQYAPATNTVQGLDSSQESVQVFFTLVGVIRVLRLQMFNHLGRENSTQTAVKESIGRGLRTCLATQGVKPLQEGVNRLSGRIVMTCNSSAASVLTSARSRPNLSLMA